jgi:hypothetical protein
MSEPRTRAARPALHRVDGIGDGPLYVKAFTRAGAIRAATAGRIVADRVDALEAVGIDAGAIIDGTGSAE